jgi:hypothetical protein
MIVVLMMESLPSDVFRGTDASPRAQTQPVVAGLQPSPNLRQFWVPGKRGPR